MSDTTTGEDSTNIITVEVTDKGDPVDLTSADLTYELTDEPGEGETLVTKTDSDSTVYLQDGDVDANLEKILPNGLDDVDASAGKIVVEIEPDELPEAGVYGEEIRATWSSGRSFASEPREVYVGQRATEN